MFRKFNEMNLQNISNIYLVRSFMEWTRLITKFLALQKIQISCLLEIFSPVPHVVGHFAKSPSHLNWVFSFAPVVAVASYVDALMLWLMPWRIIYLIFTGTVIDEPTRVCAKKKEDLWTWETIYETDSANYIVSFIASTIETKMSLINLE